MLLTQIELNVMMVMMMVCSLSRSRFAENVESTIIAFVDIVSNSRGTQSWTIRLGLLGERPPRVQ